MLLDCELKRVELNGTPGEFPIGATATAADGLGCYGFDVGIEVFSSTSSDGVTYTATSQIYTNRRIVLENDVVFGTVNANERHYRAAVDALASADLDWLHRLITRRVLLTKWTDALDRQADDVKVVVDMAK